MSDEQTDISLRQLFQNSWQRFRSIENLFGQELQAEIKKLIPIFIHIKKSVEELDFFSINEDLEDLTISSIPFILIDAILGQLFSKQFTERNERKEQVETAIRYYNEFKMLTLQFNLTQINWPSRNRAKTPKDEHQSRDMRIQIQKEKKELEQITDNFIKRLIKDPESLDDSFIKDQYLKCIRQLQINVVEDMENLALEQSFLSQSPPSKPLPSSNITSQKPKTFIIAKNELQKKVFGAGYPSTPTMTVEEFAEQEMKKILPSSEFALFNKQVAAQQAKASKNKWLENTHDQVDEENADVETKESLQKERNFDDWKDDHRRGSGNRLGMG